MFASFIAGAVMLGMARGAMDVFMEVLPTRGPITFTGWTKTAEAPVLHHQLARAQLDLEGAELFQDKLLRQWQSALERKMTTFDRVQSRAWLGEITRLARDSATGLFRASGASHVVLDADIQRYFRDINTAAQHAHLQPNSSSELYGRVLAGMGPDTVFLNIVAEPTRATRGRPLGVAITIPRKALLHIGCMRTDQRVMGRVALFKNSVVIALDE